MLIVVYDFVGKQAKEDVHFLVEKLQEIVDPSKIKFSNNGFGINVDHVHIFIRYGDAYKLKGMKADYFYSSSSYVGKYLSALGAKELNRLFDICELVKKEVTKSCGDQVLLLLTE